jgi:hypothetical protein
VRRNESVTAAIQPGTKQNLTNEGVINDLTLIPFCPYKKPIRIKFLLAEI